MSDMNLDAEIALENIATFIFDILGPKIEEGRFIRDVFGQISYILPEKTPNGLIDRISEGNVAVLPYAQATPIIDPKSPLHRSLLRERGTRWVDSERRFSIELLDRRLAGEAWLQEPTPASEQPVRIAFYGLKGGVGRSTALAVAASALAGTGLNALVIDLDLEAPGQSDILLNPDRVPEYGVIDWLTARTAGLHAADLVPDLTGGSPFTRGAGIVDVVPASGRSSERYPAGFLSKLARAYTPGSLSESTGIGFAGKVSELIQQLSERRNYDVVLIDVRAGLHETSAASILGLGCYCYLFGTSSPQTFSGYRILLDSIRQAMSSWPKSTDVRDRFRMVHGRASASSAERTVFLAKCWDLWLGSLYDAVGDEPDPSAFTFDLEDEQGPHFPLVIQSSESFVSIDPRSAPDLLDSTSYGAPFGDFTNHLLKMVKTGGNL